MAIDGPCFVDANVPMYAVGSAHPLKQPCVEILRAIARSELGAVTNSEVLQEILHRYDSLRQRSRGLEIAALFLSTVPDVLPVAQVDLVAAMRLMREHPQLRTRDAVHLAVMARHDIRLVISGDHHVDGIPSVTRLDPLGWPWPTVGNAE